MTPLSILELVRVTEETDARGALDNARDLAAHAEDWGYRRLWVAEHHNMAGIASAATAVVIAHIAGGTKTHPGRLGRHHAAQPRALCDRRAVRHAGAALSRPHRPRAGPRAGHGSAHVARAAPFAGKRRNFPQDVLELQALLAPAGPSQRIQAVPAAGTNVPLWILGSSHFGALLAAELGLPYAFASHFAPAELICALEIYRETLQAVGATRATLCDGGREHHRRRNRGEARRLATTQQMSFTNIFRGTRGLSHPPIDDIETYWTPMEKAQAMQMLARTIIGSPDTVRKGMAALVAETGADELMIVSDVYEHAKRVRSFELIAEAAGLARKA